jgi:hypothetical protein
MDYEDIAELYEGAPWSGTGGGSIAPREKKRKHKAKPTTVGKIHVGGNAWGTTDKQCPKGCSKKCCVV